METPLWLFGFYFPEISRLAFFFVPDRFFPFAFLNRWTGRLELLLGWMRDYTAVALSLYLFGFRVYGWVELGTPWTPPLELVFLGLSIYARWWRWRGLLPLAEFAHLNPCVHPSEFFDHLYARLGLLPHRLPEKPKRLINPDHLHFRKNKKPKLSFFIFLRGLYETYLFLALIYKVFLWKGGRHVRPAGSGLSVVWAARIAQLARMDVRVEQGFNAAMIQNGKIIYALNHTSVFDFCLSPLAFRRETKEGHAASFFPSFMVAKDHFKDNFFLYRGVGMGKLLEAWGMVFVDRKKKSLEKAKKNISLAVKKLIASQTPFAVYPQGTRARGQMDRDGSRWDAAYFCVGKKERLQKEEGHFKKGVGFIAVETALSLLKHRLGGKVFVIPVAMKGLGVACPKGAIQIQTEASIHIRLGSPMTVNPEELWSFKDLSYQETSVNPDYQRRVLEIVKGVDLSLQQLLDLRTRLERRFFMDLREMLAPQALEEVAVAIKEWRNQGNLIYVLLDYIYALPPKRWGELLMELANRLRRHTTREELIEFRAKVAEYF